MLDRPREPDFSVNHADLEWLKDKESRPESLPPTPNDLGQPIDFHRIFADILDPARADRPAVANTQDSMDQHPFLDQEPAMAEPPTPPPESEEAPIVKIEAAPEFPGAPYADEMFGNLHLGPEYPALKAKFEDPSLPTLEKQRVAWQIASLHVQAAENNAWWDGPLNTRRTISPTQSEIPEPEKPPFVDDSPNNGDLDVDLDDLPKIDESELLNNKSGTEDPTVLVMNPLPAEEPPVAESGNWLQRKWRRFRRGIEDFAEYTNRHRLESKALAFVGGFAGMGSAITGAVAAEYAVAAGAGLLAGPVGIATALAVNYFGFSKLMYLWSENKMKKEVQDFVPDSHKTTEQFMQDVELDHRGRVKAFAYGDVVGKIVSGTYLKTIFNHPNDTFKNTGEKMTKSDLPDHRGLEEFQHHGQGEPSTLENIAQPDLQDHIPTAFTEHVVHGHNEALTQILADHGLAPYSEKYIEFLQLNRDTLADMLRQMYPKGNVPYLVDISTNPPTYEYLTLDQAIHNIDTVIERGYPDPSRLNPDDVRQGLTDMFNAIRAFKDGTILKIPSP